MLVGTLVLENFKNTDGVQEDIRVNLQYVAKWILNMRIRPFVFVLFCS